MRSLALALLLVCSACGARPASDDALGSVRLGMAPRDVRDRFQPNAAGQWQTALGSGDDTVLEWTAKDPTLSVAHARFEFHLGMLVAIRAETHQNAPRERVSSTPKTVTREGPNPEGGSVITVLARDCPTHKDEAEALAARASR